MPTTYKDQFFSVDPGAPPAVGTPLTFQRVEFTDEDDDGNIETGTGDTWNGNTISQVWQDDTLTINVPGIGNVTYTGVTFYFANGDPAVFTPTDGQVLQNGTFVSSTFVTTATQTPVTDFGPTCFTPGTLIETPGGPVAIENLRIGDKVSTLDNGSQAIRFITDDTYRASGNAAPVLFEPGALGNDISLIVSPQHRMLVTGWRSQLYWGLDEALVAAKHLVNNKGIRSVSGGSVRYIHLLFDNHQIIFGNGIPSESLHPECAIARAGPDEQQQLRKVVIDRHGRSCTDLLAKPVIKGREATLLAA